ncbi:MAG: glyoxalase/bleomycin resistance/extradiol dioxygenase family protein [Bacteroidota bacterium]
MKLTPYIHFAGYAEEALNFYKEVLGAEIAMLIRYEESPMQTDEDHKQKIFHARLVFDGNMIMISDTFKGNAVHTNGNIQLNVEMQDKLQMENVFGKMAAGGKITMPLQDQFWGANLGMLEDRFGVSWMFNHEHAAAPAAKA